MRTTYRLCSALVLAVALVRPALAAENSTGPWDLAELKKPPRITWVDKGGSVRKLYYESEPFQGKPTRVFAYYAAPEKREGKLPAMVLVHGGGGKAFREWATLWAKRGYIAIAMDLAGNGPDGKRLPDGGPGQADTDKFPRKKIDLKEIWSFHAVAAVIRAGSLLASLPEVDAERIGVTGISWGGYLTCMVAGLDDRFKVAVPVYGCGFLHENSVWLNTFAHLPPDWRKEWVASFDPSAFIKRARMPMLFVNGTNDFAYPLDSYQKTYRLVKNRKLCVTVNMPHGHVQGWDPMTIGLFADQYLKNGKSLPELTGEMSYARRGFHLFAEIGYKTATPLEKAQVHWTTDVGPWQKRKWVSMPATIHTKSIRAEIPKIRPLVFFITAQEKRGGIVSTEHVVLEKQTD
jgi:cephalosporin-C deacetylase-like acetyl esterase